MVHRQQANIIVILYESAPKLDTLAINNCNVNLHQSRNFLELVFMSIN